MLQIVLRNVLESDVVIPWTALRARSQKPHCSHMLRRACSEEELNRKEREKDKDGWMFC